MRNFRRPGVRAAVRRATLVHFLLFAPLCPAVAQDAVAQDDVVEDAADVGKAVDPAATARELVDRYRAPETGADIAALGASLARDPEGMRAALEALDGDASIEARSLRAELLWWAARGETGREQRGNRERQRGERFPLAEIGPLAGDLLADPDPFVRGLAEWALAIRLSAAYEHPRDPRPWPDPADSPDWYAAWAALDGEDLLACDYVRDAVLQNAHRSGEALAGAAEALRGRVEDVVRYSLDRDPSPSLRETLRRHAAAVVRAQKALEAGVADRPDDLEAQRRAWMTFRLACRRAILANPDLDIEQLLLATRTNNEIGNITNGHLRDVHGPGGDIYIKSGLDPADPVRGLGLQERIGAGHFRGMDLGYDADRVVFSYLTQEDGSGTAHLYEIGTDGEGLRRLAHKPFQMDIEPAYLPSGDIVFCSDRSNYGSQCAGTFLQDKMIVNLYRCGPNGEDIRPLSNNKDFDRHPAVLENGQIVFLHWEYQERHLWQTHTLWISRPDGSGTDALYKQHIPGGPMSLRSARPIPGKNELVAIACGHHNAELGAVMLVDYTKGINDPSGMRLVTLGCSRTEGGYGEREPVPEGGVRVEGGHFGFPYPLSEKSFLAVYSYKKPERDEARNFALYYIDVFGNRELIHRDPRASVCFAAPMAPRRKPPVIADHNPPPRDERYASLFVNDVHSGLGGEIPAGTVKYLRIAQKTPWPAARDEDKDCGFNDLHYVPAGAWTRVFGVWDWGPARVIGTVPVEPDGSAYFKVPADQPVYFQALDENFVEVRRMRSNVTFRNGEYRSCIGCHETGPLAPPVGRPLGLAARRAPSMPEPPSWGDQVLPNFEDHIQPILDRNCVSCHSGEDAEQDIDLSGTYVREYLQSYRTLFGLGPDEATPYLQDYWRYWHGDEPMPEDDGGGRPALEAMERSEFPGQLIAIANRFGGPEVTGTGAFGSGKSRLVQVLMDQHQGVREEMPEQDWIDLVTWIDLNAPYWGGYADKDHYRAEGRARWVDALFPDPWQAPPAGEWVIEDGTVRVAEPVLH